MYGLQCFDVDGDKNFDTETAATRIVWQKKVSAGASSNEVVVPSISGLSIGIVAYSDEVDSGGPFAAAGATHTVSVSGTTVTWTSRGNATYCPSVDTNIVIFAYD